MQILNKKMVILVVMLLVSGICYAENLQKSIFIKTERKVLCLDVYPQGESMVIGTDDGVYFGRDSFNKIDLCLVGEVTDIVILPEGISFINKGNLYFCDIEREKKEISLLEGKGLKGVIYCENIFAWSDKDLYVVDNNVTKKIPIKINDNEFILDIDVIDGTIFVLTSNSLIAVSSEGTKKISLDSYYEEDIIEEEEQDFSRSRKLSKGKGSMLVPTYNGATVFDSKGNQTAGISTTGLPSSKVLQVYEYEKGKVFITDANIFVMNNENILEDGINLDRFQINCIEFKKGNIYIGKNSGIFVYKPTKIEDHYEDKNEDETERISLDVPIGKVHKMAIEYAEVDPEKISAWREKAKWKALLPKISLDFSESIDENVEIYKSATTSYIVTGPNETGADWGVDLSWDLSDLIWNDAQTSIDVRSKLMVQLREDILEEVTRIYFERKRIIVELKHKNDDASEKILRIEELNAYLDAFTGGGFSEELSKMKTN